MGADGGGLGGGGSGCLNLCIERCVILQVSRSSSLGSLQDGHKWYNPETWLMAECLHACLFEYENRVLSALVRLGRYGILVLGTKWSRCDKNHPINWQERMPCGRSVIKTWSVNCDGWNALWLPTEQEPRVKCSHCLHFSKGLSWSVLTPPKFQTCNVAVTH